MRRQVVAGVVAATLLVGACSSGTAPDGESPPDQTDQASAEAPAVQEPPPPPPEPEPPPGPDLGDWLVSTDSNPLDDSRIIVASLDAVEGTGGFSDDPVRLYARCRSNRTEVYIVWHDYLGDDGDSTKRVTYRFPPASARAESWGISTDGDSTFVRRPIPFLRQLVQAERLVLQTTPYLEPPTTAVFALTGSEEVLAPLAQLCNWSLTTT